MFLVTLFESKFPEILDFVVPDLEQFKQAWTNWASSQEIVLIHQSQKFKGFNHLEETKINQD